MHFIEQEKESHMEYFDIVDEQGNPTGQTVERKQAHRNNILVAPTSVNGFRSI